MLTPLASSPLAIDLYRFFLINRFRKKKNNKNLLQQLTAFTGTRPLTVCASSPKVKFRIGKQYILSYSSVRIKCVVRSTPSEESKPGSEANIARVTAPKTENNRNCLVQIFKTKVKVVEYETTTGGGRKYELEELNTGNGCYFHAVFPEFAIEHTDVAVKSTANRSRFERNWRGRAYRLFGRVSRFHQTRRVVTISGTRDRTPAKSA